MSNANKQDAGGLLPCPGCGKSDLDHCPADFVAVNGLTRGMIVRCAWCHFAAPESAWNRRNGEQCRAAPAGGDDLDTLLALVPRPAMAHHKMDDAEEREIKRVNRFRDRVIENIKAHCASRPDSAPAGSGEALELADRLDRDWDSGRVDWDNVKDAAALLRKLQQGAEYVMVPRSLAVSGAEVCAEWLDLFAETPGLDKYERYTYAPCVEITRDQFRAASQGQEGV